MNRNRNTKGILIRLLMAVCVILISERAARADFVFGTPENLGAAINTSAREVNPAISYDDLSLCFAQSRGDGGYDIWLATRAMKDGPWDTLWNIGPNEDIPFVAKSVQTLTNFTTADGLEFYYWDQRPGGYGKTDLYVLTRETIQADWSAPMNLGPLVNSPYEEHTPSISADGLELYFSGYSGAGARPGGSGHSDLWVTTRPTRDDSWSEPVNLGPVVNSSAQDARPNLSTDGLLLFFDSQRPGGYGLGDLYVARRASRSDPWGPPVNLGPTVNSPAFEESPHVPADGSTLYYDCDRPGGHGAFDLWQVPIEPVVDFNGDGAVDCIDICDLMDHWGTDNSLYDIGPTPFGDGVVDVEDLKVFIAEWEKANPPKDQ